MLSTKADEACTKLPSSKEVSRRRNGGDATSYYTHYSSLHSVLGTDAESLLPLPLVLSTIHLLSANCKSTHRSPAIADS